ncbi:uncharacterized protein LOC130725172 [Lotus japonicus]|uniref:uncharacterized protein LOC130725172 n=1 Tax=Lotus japonicus TaxID=34305 RepID=UPI0025895163|nr:uncharacterized protein LOC130725172 [Lotus japonicus]
MDFHSGFVSLLSHRNNILGVAVMWWTWRWRNSRVFDPQAPTLNKILRCVLRDEALWREAMQKHGQHSVVVEHGMDSNTSMEATVTVDGSWIPQIGRMGSATVIKDNIGSWVTGISKSFNHGCDFLAELLSVELGLMHAFDNGYKRVKCLSDCGMLVGVLQSGHATSTLWNWDDINRVRDLMAKFQEVQVVHIDRDRNNTDALAREACTRGSPIQVWKRPPSFVYAAMYLDSLS